LSDIHFTALFTSLYCLTFTLLLCLFILLLCLFILLLCLPHCNVWHSFYCSVYPNCQTIQRGKQSSKMNVRQYNGVYRAVKWMSDNTMGIQSSKMNVLSSDIYFTALYTPLYCLTFTLLLCLLILLLCLFILLLCLPHCIVWHSCYSSKMNVRQYNGYTEQSNECQTIKWVKQSSKMKVRQYNGVNRAVTWMSDNTIFDCSVYPLYCLTFILLLCIPHYIV
jgi:hypothetical protein